MNNSLSTFDPLERVLFHDDFDHGMQGWTLLTGNYDRSLDTVLPQQRDFRPPMLSNLTMWDTGTAGSLNGTYAMKLATRPNPGSIAVALKRTTFRKAGPIQVEAYFTVKPEATEMRLAEADVRAFGIFLDLQDDNNRVMPHLRFGNVRDGERHETWAFKRHQPSVTTISESTRTHFHLGPDNWEDLPDGHQQLCYNELPTKQNWHYLKLRFDLETMSFLHFQVNSRVFNPGALAALKFPAWPNLWGMLNVGFWVETDVANRAFLYLDSVVVSTVGGE